MNESNRSSLIKNGGRKKCRHLMTPLLKKCIETTIFPAILSLAIKINSLHLLRIILKEQAMKLNLHSLPDICLHYANMEKPMEDHQD